MTTVFITKITPSLVFNFETSTNDQIKIEKSYNPRNKPDYLAYYGASTEFYNHELTIKADQNIGPVILVVVSDGPHNIIAETYRNKGYIHGCHVITVSETDTEENIKHAIATRIKLIPLIQRATQELERLEAGKYRNADKKIKALQDAINFPDETKLHNALKLQRNKQWDNIFKNEYSKPTSYRNAVQLPKVDKKHSQNITECLSSFWGYFSGTSKKVEKILAKREINGSDGMEENTANAELNKIFPIHHPR